MMCVVRFNRPYGTRRIIDHRIQAINDLPKLRPSLRDEEGLSNYERKINRLSPTSPRARSRRRPTIFRQTKVRRVLWPRLPTAPTASIRRESDCPDAPP